MHNLEAITVQGNNTITSEIQTKKNPGKTIITSNYRVKITNLLFEVLSYNYVLSPNLAHKCNQN